MDAQVAVQIQILLAVVRHVRVQVGQVLADQAAVDQVQVELVQQRNLQAQDLQQDAHRLVGQ